MIARQRPYAQLASLLVLLACMVVVSTYFTSPVFDLATPRFEKPTAPADARETSATADLRRIVAAVGGELRSSAAQVSTPTARETGLPIYPEKFRVVGVSRTEEGVSWFVKGTESGNLLAVGDRGSATYSFAMTETEKSFSDGAFLYLIEGGTE